MVHRIRPRLTFERYLDAEVDSGPKHEFLDGHVWLMAVGTPEHAALAMNVGTLLNNQLRDRRCRVYSSDLRVRVGATGLTTYPDVTVICGQVERDPADR